MSLPTRPLGPLHVSTLCLGTMMFADQTGEAEARDIVASAREAGANFIDTADVYSQGKSEEMTGRLIAADRDRWVLATKLGNRMGDDARMGYSPAWMRQACEDSLTRLGTDRIDLYYMHRDYPGLDLEPALRAMDRLIREGKVRHWGLSNFRGWRIAEAVSLARALGMPAPIACQPYYNLLNRMPEVEILPACEAFGIGVVPYSPIARGVLSGKYRAGEAPAADTRAGRADKRMMQTEWRPESLAVAERLIAHCTARGITLVEFATAWVLAHRAVRAVIAGPRTLAQWQGYLGAPRVVLDAGEEALVDSLVAPGHPSTPGFTDPLYPLPPRTHAPR